MKSYFMDNASHDELKSFLKKLMRNGAKSRNVRYKVFDRAQGKCEVCNDYQPWILEIHHIRPVSNLGGNKNDNLIALCPNCHAILEKLKRGGENHSLEHWIQDRYGNDIYDKFISLFWEDLQ